MRYVILFISCAMLGCGKTPAVTEVSRGPNVINQDAPDPIPEFKQIPYPIDLSITSKDVLDCLAESDSNSGFGPMVFAELTSRGKTIYVNEDANVTFIPTLSGTGNLAVLELEFLHNGQPEDSLRQKRFEGAITDLYTMMQGFPEDIGPLLRNGFGQLDSPQRVTIYLLKFDCVRTSAADGRSVLTWRMTRKPQGEK